MADYQGKIETLAFSTLMAGGCRPFILDGKSAIYSN